MEIKRDVYLNRLIHKKDNGMIKVITGIRRCGKSYLLFNLYDKYLRSIGVKDDEIIKLALDDYENRKYLDPDELYRDIIISFWMKFSILYLKKN